MSSDKCEKCEKCGVVTECGIYVPAYVELSYLMCTKCCDEWFNNGYSRIWWSFYISENNELANKFVLDFLGKLD